MEQFDKKKVRIGGQVYTESEWQYVYYNKQFVGEIVYTRTWKSTVSVYNDMVQLGEVKGKTKKEMAENLCKYVVEYVNYESELWQKRAYLLNNKQ